MEKNYTIDDLRDIMKELRSDHGCPWDRLQTHDTIKKSLIEECYEAIDALDKKDDKAFSNELGDVLLQVVFHSQLADERGAFDFDDVVNEICNKLISRHTHVFGPDKAANAEEALGAWEKNKKKEKGQKTYTEALNDIPKYFPALMRAEKVQKKAAGAGFDWDSAEEVYKKVYEECEEVHEAKTQEEREEEIGDLLFSAVNLARHLNVTPETALARSCEKFISRFAVVEKECTQKGLDMSECSLDELDRMWKKAKIK